MLFTLPNALLFVGFLFIAIYFYLFNRTMKMISSKEIDRFRKETGSKIDLLTTGVLFGCFFYFETYEAKILFSVLIVLSSIISTNRHQNKLRALNFDKAFGKRLQNISPISMAGIIFVLSSFVLNAYTT